MGLLTKEQKLFLLKNKIDTRLHLFLNLKQDLLRKAEKEEEKYSWFEAAELYNQVADRTPNKTDSAKLQKNAGYCYSRASCQAESVKVFTKRRELAIAAYEKAAQFYQQGTDSKSQGKSSECKMLAEYNKSWTTSNPDEKRRILDHCLILGKASLGAYEKSLSEPDYARTCTDLLSYLIERQYTARDSKEMTNIAEDGVEYANKAIKVLPKLENKKERLRAYSLASIQRWYASNVSEQSDKAEELAKQSLVYSEKALLLLKETDDPFYRAISNWAAAICTLLFTEKAESSHEYASEMLRQAEVAEDNYLIGIALYLLIFIINWMMAREPDSNKQKEGHRQIVELSKEAIKRLQLVHQDFFAAQTRAYSAESYSYLARDINIVRKERKTILRKALEIGREGLTNASRSGSLDAKGSTLHALSKALHFSANFETNKSEKTKLLEEALVHRKTYNDIVNKGFPSNDWVNGVGKNYSGLILLDLARLEDVKNKKIALLQNAISDVEDGVSRCRKAMTQRPLPTLIATVAKFEEGFGEALCELYHLVEDDALTRKAIEVYQNAAEDFKRIDMPNRVAESYWRIAMSQSLLNEHKQAADNFVTAFREYETASKFIPHFSAFYLDYAAYMKAWSEIEKAHLAHELEQYADAMEHFQKVSSILEHSKLWSYIAPNFEAWSLLEHGEDLSRKDEGSESLEAFKKAAELFIRARRVFEKEIDEIDGPDEKQKAIELSKACTRRTEYCSARMNVEAAKDYDRKGKHVESAERYEVAACIFEKMLASSQNDAEKREISPFAYTVRAWQRMKMADAKASPELYFEASELFSKAKEHALEDRTNLLASGNSAVCKALQHGTLFEENREKTEFSKAKQYLESAATYYIRVGLDNASAWTTATEVLLDAYNYLTNAEMESDVRNKNNMLMLAEKCLEQSAKLYESANYIGRRNEVTKIIGKVKEKRKFVLTLGKLLTAPGEASTTKAIPAPSPTVEEPVGLKKFEHELIQAKLSAQKRDVSAGEDFCVNLNIANLGKTAAFLGKIEDMIPEGFDPQDESDSYSIENHNLNINGKRLDPLKTETIKIRFRSFCKGTFKMRPRILLVDEMGLQVLNEPEPLIINISEVIMPNRISTGYRPLDLVLLGGIPEGYSVILTAPSYDERGLLIHKFLEAGTIEDTETFYITVDATGTTNLIEKSKNFSVFICNPRADEMVQNRLNVYKLRGVENLTDIDIAITSALRSLDRSKTRPRRACIEITSDVLLRHHAVSTRRWLNALLPELRSRRFTTIAVLNPQMHPSQEVQAILDVFDGEINIYEEETNKGTKRTLTIKRMSNQKYVETELPLKKETMED